jgi:hypothetical protein
MPLLDRFRSRPAWQSKDPEIRASAVRQLGGDQQELLLAIAREDEDPRVRRLAVRKLQAVADLAAIAREDADAGVRGEASEQLTRRAMEGAGPEALAALETLGDARHLVSAARGAKDPAVKRAALMRLTDPRNLAAVARGSEEPALRQAALEAITDVTVLADLALRSDQKDVAVHATERLGDRALLESVAARARNKAAARRARTLLEAMGPGPAPAPPSPPSFEEPPMDSASEHEAGPPPMEEEAAPEESAAEAPSAPPEEAAPDAAEDSAEDSPAEAPAAEAPAPALAEATAEQRGEQEELCRQAETAAAATAALQARREVLALRKRAQASALLGADLAARFEQALAQAGQRDQEARVVREKEQAENLARLVALCDRLEALARAETVTRREAEQALRESRAVAEQPPPLPGGKDTRALMQRLKTARTALFPRVQEIREADEWTRWANATQQEELCKRVEALLTEEDLDKTARELREIDEKWKQVRQAPRDQAEALWKRFKAARDQVQVRCREHFAVLTQQRGESLKQKQELCEKAEALADSSEWVKTAEALRALQEEWKKTGPVPRRQGKVLWERFRAACDRFFGRRKEDLDKRKQDWTQNQEKKEALCVRAEALAESTEWEKASAEIKRLQAEWKTVGAVRKSKSQALWERFHGACDRFFERYKQRGSLERAGRTAALEALCAELEELAVNPATSDDAGSAVKSVMARWRENHGPAEGPLAERRQQALARLLEAQPEALRGTDLDPSTNLSRMEKLCQRVEAQLVQPQATGSLAERLREALASNTMGGKGQAEAKWREATAEVEAAQAAWKKLAPVPGAEAESLRKRFRSACDRFFEVRPAQAARTR